FNRRRRYHGPQELFNHRHSSLRNVIERTFGVLKQRFPLLRHMSRYDMNQVTKVKMTFKTKMKMKIQLKVKVGVKVQVKFRVKLEFQMFTEMKMAYHLCNNTTILSPHALNLKLKTHVIRKYINPEWNKDLTLSISDLDLPIKLEIGEYELIDILTPLEKTQFWDGVGIVLDMAKSCTFPLPLLAVAFQQLIAGSSHGHGNDGDDTLIKAWEKVYGVNITNAVNMIMEQV
ncbi:Protein C2-DOMAIN ABA-RELATED 1, partial [Camellia lanceoleosa]